MILRNLSRIRPESGFCWVAELGDDIIAGDTAEFDSKSLLRVFEDEVELGPGRTSHETIRQKGRGAFSHWERVLFFSASDNSDPSSNGRTYRILAPIQTEQGLRGCWLDNHGAMKALPVNYQLAARDLDNVEGDAEYALTCAHSYLGGIPGGKIGLVGKTVLEIGPGPSFATALILKAWGAKTVAVSDRYLVGFDADYHGALYRQIANKLLDEDRSANIKPLKICAQVGHVKEQVLSLDVALEEMSREFKSFFDITLSNAVLEHLYSPSQAICGLYALTAPGGLGLHQVDFRDHRDFDRPLEYLLLDEMSFAQLFESCHGECGNRVRPFQMKHMFRQAGFGEVAFESNLEASRDYLTDFIPRLRTAKSSLFFGIDEKHLVPIGGRFVVRK